MFDPKEYFAQVNPQTNFIEIVSISTGLVVKILSSLEDEATRPVEFNEITRADGTKISVQKGIDLDNLPLPRNRIPYSITLASLFCEHIANGLGITKACKQPGMPSYSTVRHWVRKYPEFSEMIDDAFRDRAHFYADEIQEEKLALKSLANPTDQEIKVAQYAMEANKWSAEKGNPQRFGNKIQHSGEVKHSVTLVIDTGVRRADDPNYFPDETKKLKELEDSRGVTFGEEKSLASSDDVQMHIPSQQKLEEA